MNSILKQTRSISEWQNKFNIRAQQNKFNSINSKLITTECFEDYQNFIETIFQKNPRKSKKKWVSNQRRILYIILNCISLIHNIPLEQFKQEQYQLLKRVFYYKEKYSIVYEVRKLITNFQQNRRRWDKDQEDLLILVYQKSVNKNKWNEIARDMFIESQGQYFRQGKHCRERFYKLQYEKGSYEKFSSNKDSSSNEYSSEDQFHGSAKILKQKKPNKSANKQIDDRFLQKQVSVKKEIKIFQINKSIKIQESQKTVKGLFIKQNKQPIIQQKAIDYQIANWYSNQYVQNQLLMPSLYVPFGYFNYQQYLNQCLYGQNNWYEWQMTQEMYRGSGYTQQPGKN